MSVCPTARSRPSATFHPQTRAKQSIVPALHVLPGVIDSQVHFREPGPMHKEDLASGSAGAAAGGVTAFFEMPNTSPLTITAEAIDDKLNRAAGRCWTDYAFYVGGAAASIPHLPETGIQEGHLRGENFHGGFHRRPSIAG